MLDQVTRIYNFNRVNGLLDKPYNDFLESSFQIEEALEGFSLFDLVNTIRSDYNGEETPKEYARLIIGACSLPEVGSFLVPTEIPDVDRLDKHLDSIVYNIGAIAKLGLTPEQLLQALSIVMDANEAKNGCPKDSLGKLMKPENFPNPEPRLEQLLLARGEQ